MASPPKPWEQAGASPTSATPPLTSTTSTTSPAIPLRPESLTASVNQNAAAYSRMGATPGYGSYGGAYPSTYSSPYSGLGGYGGMGGYGGGMYGSGYGGYRSMGYGGMYGGMGGMPDQNNPESLTNRVNQSTQATFQVLEGVVGAFGGFAQMLESTYMTTHSSFYGMLDPVHPLSPCTADANLFTNSRGRGGRAVWKPPRYPWAHPWYIHNNALDENIDCEDHWTTTTSRRHGTYTGILCQVRRPTHPGWLASLCETQSKALDLFYTVRFRSALPNDQNDKVYGSISRRRGAKEAADSGTTNRPI